MEMADLKEGSHRVPSRQLMALFKKSATIKKRQKCSSICHLVVPLLCVVLVGLIQVAFNKLNQNAVTINTGGYTQDLFPDADGTYRGVFETFYVDTEPSVGTRPLNANGTGFLAKIPQNITAFEGVNNPYFVKYNSADEIDNKLAAMEADVQKIPSDQRRNGEIANGAILFNSFQPSPSGADPAVLDYTYQWPNSSDDNGNYWYLSSFPLYGTPFSGSIQILEELLHSAFLNQLSGGRFKQIYATLQDWTYTWTSSFDGRSIISSVSSALFPLGLSLLLPTFIYAIVEEKQMKLRELMKMMGMKMKNYWLMTYVFDLVLFALVSTVFIISGIAFFQIKFLLDPTPFILLLLVWGHTLIAMALFISAFLNRNRTITAIVLYLLVIISTAMGGIFPSIWSGSEYPESLIIYPFFAFAKGINLLSSGCATGTCHFNTLPGEYGKIIGVMIAQTIVFAVLGMYFDQIMPKEFGVRKPVLFPIHAIRDFFQNRNKAKGYSRIDSQIQLSVDDVINSEEEDSDVRAERMRIQSGTMDPRTPVIIQSLSKQYPGAKKYSLSDLYLSISEGEFFGLWDPTEPGRRRSSPS